MNESTDNQPQSNITDPLIKKIIQLDIPITWLAKQCGYSRTQVSNWVNDPDKFPIPDDQRNVFRERLKTLGRKLSAIK